MIAENLKMIELHSKVVNSGVEFGRALQEAHKACDDGFYLRDALDVADMMSRHAERLLSLLATLPQPNSG